MNWKRGINSPRIDWSHLAPRVRVRQGSFSVSKIGAKPIDLSDPYYLAIASSWPVFITLALTVLLGTIALFAALFLIRPDSLHGSEPATLARVLFFRLQTLTTTGGTMASNSIYGYCVAAIESVIGLALLRWPRGYRS